MAAESIRELTALPVTQHVTIVTKKGTLSLETGRRYTNQCRAGHEAEATIVVTEQR